MNPTSHLKLIALLLPDDISQQVKNEQLHIANTWGPKHAWRTPPHITIIPPISVTVEEEKKLWTTAKKISSSSYPFLLQLDGYGCFKPRVVFIGPVENPALNELYRVARKEILSSLPHLLNRYPDRAYHPHVTLAHRDVTPEQFTRIWTYYTVKSFSAGCVINSFWVLRHSHDKWIPEREFPLSGTIQ